MKGESISPVVEPENTIVYVRFSLKVTEFISRIFVPFWKTSTGMCPVQSPHNLKHYTLQV